MLVAANIFQPLIDVFESVIKFFHSTVGVPWGWSIVLLTIVIRAVLLPLTIKQFKSMRKLQVLQPQMKEIQNKYKEDKQRQQQELMKFYKENQVNPLASCLPLAAQMPVFVSLFYMLEKNLRPDICPKIQHAYAAIHGVGQTRPCGAGNGAGFLFIHDLTDKPTGIVLIVLIAIYVCTQMGSTLMMRNPMMDKKQQNLMLFLPIVFVFFFIRYPAGLLVYWITTNLWTMTQQFIIRQRLGPPGVPLATAGATAGGGAGGGGTGEKARRPSPKREAPANGAAPPGRSGGGGLGGALREKLKPAEPATVTAERRGAAAPPPPPRKKKKRSGRRR